MKNMTNIFDFEEFTAANPNAPMGQYFHDLGRHLYAKHNYPDTPDAEIETKLMEEMTKAFMKEKGISPTVAHIPEGTPCCGGGQVK